MRHKPTAKYNGLTIVLSQPSRFDQHRLISGTAGHYFDTECLNASRNYCDVRTSDTIKDGIIPGTRGLLLLGDRAFKDWAGSDYKDYSLSEQRGNPLSTNWKIPTIASYTPQDAMDMVDHESRLNPLLNKEDEEYEQDENDEGEDAFTTKRKGATRRSNFRFWLKRDTEKLLRAIRGDAPPRSSLQGLNYRLGPSAAEIVVFLQSITSKDNLYLDIETSVDGGYNIFCIGVATDESPIYVFPVYRYTYSLYYSDTHNILRAFAGALERATVVCHNGFGFDLFILAWRYGIPFGKRNYDTMIASHRCYPEVEKSLGHLMSLWLWEPYHKDQGIFHPHNGLEERQLWQYNGYDVAGMRACKWAIDEYAKRVPGLSESIAQGNRCIYPYLVCSLNGITFDDHKRRAIMEENDKLQEQYLRIIQFFLDKLQYPNTLLPTSSKSCVRFFHDFLHYDVVGRSRTISKKTGKPLNTPSLNEKNFWKLKLKYPDNALIDICVKYREKKKETGMLKFNNWNIYEKPGKKNEENNIVLEGSEELAEQ